MRTFRKKQESSVPGEWRWSAMTLFTHHLAFCLFEFMGRFLAWVFFQNVLGLHRKMWHCIFDIFAVLYWLKSVHVPNHFSIHKWQRLGQPTTLYWVITVLAELKVTCSELPLPPNKRLQSVRRKASYCVVTSQYCKSPRDVQRYP